MSHLLSLIMNQKNQRIPFFILSVEGVLLQLCRILWNFWLYPFSYVYGNEQSEGLLTLYVSGHILHTIL